MTEKKKKILKLSNMCTKLKDNNNVNGHHHSEKATQKQTME